MAFIDSTSTQRVELLRQAEKTANLTRRVTIGSGVLDTPEGRREMYFAPPCQEHWLL